MRSAHHPRRHGELKVGLSRAFVADHAEDENEGLGEPVSKDPASENEAQDTTIGAESDPRDI